MNFRKALEYIKEQKQVGNIYHFTKIENLYSLLNGKLEPLEFISFNDTFSCTRDSCLANNPVSRDINIKNGYTVRIVLDGTKISNKFKIKPHNGLDNNQTYKTKDNNYIGKEYQEREEKVLSRNGRFKLKNYIKQIDILNDNKSNKFIDKIESKLEAMKIKYNFVRKFQRLSIKENMSMNESHELYLSKRK